MNYEENQIANNRVQPIVIHCSFVLRLMRDVSGFAKTRQGGACRSPM
ncbi:MAG: hypothetical protein ABSG82_04520 [Sedimentisphaerales bacterium]|jgi:hypothetical protein